MTVTVAEGDSVWYKHLEDGSGGISGMIIVPSAAGLIAGDVDSDGDGVTDYGEKLAGTDPLDASDFLGISTVQTSDTTMEISLQSLVPGNTYQLEFSEDLRPGLLGAAGGVDTGVRYGRL